MNYEVGEAGLGSQNVKYKKKKNNLKYDTHGKDFLKITFRFFFSYCLTPE